MEPRPEVCRYCGVSTPDYCINDRDAAACFRSKSSFTANTKAPRKPRVFVVQKQLRQDPRSGDLVPKFDLSSAEKYGELVYVLSPTAAPWAADSIMADIRDKLEDFQTTDFLLLIGNPVLIGLVSAVAADMAGRVQFLQWSGRQQSYIPVQATVFED